MGKSGGGTAWVSKVLGDLISFKTVVPPGNDYKSFADYSSNLLESLGMDVKVAAVPKSVVSKFTPEFADHPRHIVLARLGSGRPILHFNGHYDVVPEGHGWKKKPFNPIVSKGRMYGRGASDMKSGIVSVLQAIKSLKESGKEPGGTIEVSLTPDEEIGGHAGAEYMLDAGLAKPDFAMIAEPTRVDKILIGHKGSLQVLVEVHGENAHGSMPWRGRNAFDGMLGIATEVERRYSSIIQGGKRSSLHYSDGKASWPTAMFGGIARGGNQQNLVPAYSAFSIDRRIIPEEEPEAVEAELLGCIGDVGNLPQFRKYEVGTKVLNRVKPAAVSSDSKFLQRVIRSVVSIQHTQPQLEMAVGAMDAGHFINHGIDSVAYGPGELSQAHVADESVALSDVLSVAGVYQELMRQVL